MSYRVVVPMKYSTTKNGDHIKQALESDNYGLQLKKDGASYVLAKDLDGTVHLYGDRISKKTGEVIDKIDNVPHIKSFAKTFFPNGSQLVIEITSCFDWNTKQRMPKSSSKLVNSLLLCLPDKAQERQEAYNAYCGAYVFDILFWAKEEWYSKDFIDRYNKILEIRDRWSIRNKLPSWLEFAETHFIDKTELLQQWLSEGEEGGVLKKLRTDEKTSAAHFVSEVGERPKRPMHVTYKVKQMETFDMVVMKLDQPEKEFKGELENARYFDEDGTPLNRLYALGLVGSLILGAYNDDGELVPIGRVSSGLTDSIRKQIKDHEDEWIGMVVECSCMSLDKKNKTFRHPRFIRTRPDKNPETCLISEIFS